MDLGVDLVADLVATQFPGWAGLPVTALPSAAPGEAVFRLGEEFVVRLPVRPGAGTDLPRELAAVRELHGRTRFATPEVVATGTPAPGYPSAWTVLRWIPGTPADTVETATNRDLATDLAEFVRAVRELPLHGRRFAGTGPGGDLHAHDTWVAEGLDRSGDLLDVPALRALWSRLRTLPHVSADVVTHGNLLPANLLLTGDRLTGVLDVGSLGPADPAVDLLPAWSLFDAAAREEFRTACGARELDWVRGQAWAFRQAVGLVGHHARTNPRASSAGRRTLDRVLADPLV